jgi:hypothetical protein
MKNIIKFLSVFSIVFSFAGNVNAADAPSADALRQFSGVLSSPVEDASPITTIGCSPLGPGPFLQVDDYEPKASMAPTRIPRVAFVSAYQPTGDEPPPASDEQPPASDESKPVAGVDDEPSELAAARDQVRIFLNCLKVDVQNKTGFSEEVYFPYKFYTDEGKDSLLSCDCFVKGLLPMLQNGDDGSCSVLIIDESDLVLKWLVLCWNALHGIDLNCCSARGVLVLTFKYNYDQDLKTLGDDTCKDAAKQLIKWLIFFGLHSIESVVQSIALNDCYGHASTISQN